MTTEPVYTKGDATQPTGDGDRIICHICNDVGGWGRGFVLALSRRWPEPEAAYRAWYAKRESGDSGFGLGEIQTVDVGGRLSVCNMVAQRGIHTNEGVPPIRYDALDACLAKLGAHAVAQKSTVHMPRIGCGLAGGDWEKVGALVEAQLTGRGVEVTVYDFE